MGMGNFRRLRKSVLFMSAAAALLGAGIAIDGVSGSATAAGPCAVSDATLDTEEAAFLGKINAYRAANGLAPLKLSENLQRAATWMAVDLSSKRYFAHTDSAGRSPQQRAADCGYAGPAGENLAAGTDWDSSDEALAAWKASSGHNKNMLFSSYVQIGIARVYDANAQYGWYWVTEFGTEDDGTTVALPGQPAPKPSPTAAPTQPPAPKPTQPPAPAPTQPPAPQGASVPVQPGANLISWPGATSAPSAALGGNAGIVEVIYGYDAATGTWKRFGPGLPSYLNNLPSMQQGTPYWVIAKQPGSIVASQ